MQTTTGQRFHRTGSVSAQRLNAVTDPFAEDVKRVFKRIDKSGTSGCTSRDLTADSGIVLVLNRLVEVGLIAKVRNESGKVYYVATKHIRRFAPSNGLQRPDSVQSATDSLVTELRKAPMTRNEILSRFSRNTLTTAFQAGQIEFSTRTKTWRAR